MHSPTPTSRGRLSENASSSDLILGFYFAHQFIVSVKYLVEITVVLCGSAEINVGDDFVLSLVLVRLRPWSQQRPPSCTTFDLQPTSSLELNHLPLTRRP